MEPAVGACSIRWPDPDDWHLGELGYLLAAEHRGRGYAIRAARLMLDWAFGELFIARMQAVVRPDNSATMRVLDRLGFRREALLRTFRATEQGPRDVVMYALLAAEHATTRA